MQRRQSQHGPNPEIDLTDWRASRHATQKTLLRLWMPQSAQRSRILPDALPAVEEPRDSPMGTARQAVALLHRGLLQAQAKAGLLRYALHPLAPQKGDPGPAGTVVNTQSGECAAEGCDREAKTRGLCTLHYGRLRSNGTLNAAPSKAGAWNGMWKGDTASYFAIHQRLKVTRGKASDHSCSECGNRARHWAYDNADPFEREDDGGRYSTNLNHYRPMCVSCHRKFDFNHSKKKAAS